MNTIVSLIYMNKSNIRNKFAFLTGKLPLPTLIYFLKNTQQFRYKNSSHISMEQRQERAQLNNQNRHSNQTRFFFFAVCLYLLYIFSSQVSSTPDDNSLISWFDSQDTQEIPVDLCLKSFMNSDLEGHWSSTSKRKGKFLYNEKGQFSLSAISRKKEFIFNMNIKNGEYIDEGTYRIYFSVDPEKLQSKRDGKSVTIFQKNTSQAIHYSFQKQIIMRNIESGGENISAILTLSVDNKKIIKKMFLSLHDDELELTIAGKKQRVIGSIAFALILLIISYTEFSSIMEIIKGFIDGRQNPIHYSFFTILIAMMWDATFCLISFSESFQYSVIISQCQESFVLFLVPAFLFCLLCTNLQLRFMFEVFQKNHDGENPYQAGIKFNVLAYGSLLLTFPLLIFSNLNDFLFIGISLIFLPQIYTNAISGKRPNLSSPLYSEFLLIRFLIIVTYLLWQFYIKCFPLNTFELQPNYFLGVGCFSLILCQFGLLWIQKVYGPKKVIPNFFLPPIYNYSCEEQEINVEAPGENVRSHFIFQQQCSICLCSLHENPPGFGNENGQQTLRLMKTPCNHKYHGSCLVQWMKIKLECPQCRTKLPLYQ